MDTRWLDSLEATLKETNAASAAGDAVATHSGIVLASLYVVVSSARLKGAGKMTTWLLALSMSARKIADQALVGYGN